MLAALLLVYGGFARGWPRMMSAVAAFTCLTLPLTITFVCDQIGERLSHVYIGGVTFVSAMLALSIITVGSLRAITRA
jgi:hypothetical protein